jgi:hypothetical protein
VGIDPGLTTGLAIWNPQGLPVGGTFALADIRDRFVFYSTFHKVVGWGQPMVVVCEDFLINLTTAMKSRQVDPLRIIGAIEYLCWKNGIPFHLQTAARAMTFATNEKLKQVGWYDSKFPHGCDAARHVLVWALSHPHEFDVADLKARLV